jgi:hypothetical protein
MATTLTSGRWFVHPVVSQAGLATVQAHQPLILASNWQVLRRMGVLRSEREPQVEIAEWAVAELLRLNLIPPSGRAGYDAVDAEGRTYQIRGRKNPYLMSTTSFDVDTSARPFDFLVCVFFSQALELRGIARIPFPLVRDLGAQTRGGLRFRWNSAIAAEPRIERILWPLPEAETPA